MYDTIKHRRDSCVAAAKKYARTERMGSIKWTWISYWVYKAQRSMALSPVQVTNLVKEIGRDWTERVLGIVPGTLLALVLLLVTGCRGLDRLLGVHHRQEMTAPAHPQKIAVGEGQSNIVYFSPNGEAAFLADMRQAGEDMVFINCGVGGSALYEWAADQPFFLQCVEKVHAYQAAYGGEVTTILFHQGEADAGGNNWTHTTDYAQVFEGILTAHRAAFGKPQLPIVFSQIGTHTDPGRPEWETVKAQQALVSQRCTVMIKSDQLELRADGIHFTEPSYVQHGHNFAAALIALLRSCR